MSSEAFQIRSAEEAPAQSRGALGGVSAVIAVAIAITAVLGTLTAGLVQGDRLGEGVVARYAAVAIVRSVERARPRVRDRNEPSGVEELMAVPRELLRELGVCVAIDRGGGMLDRLKPGQIDLPPPAKA